MSISEMKSIYDRLTELERRVAVLEAAIDEIADQRRALQDVGGPSRDVTTASYKSGPVRLGGPTVSLKGA